MSDDTYTLDIETARGWVRLELTVQQAADAMTAIGEAVGFTPDLEGMRAL